MATTRAQQRQMTLQEFKQTMRKKEADMHKQMKEIINEAANKILNEYKTRIFIQGKATDGSSIGKYSKNPFYYGKRNNKHDEIAGLPFTPRGKDIKAKVSQMFLSKKRKDELLKDHKGGYNYKPIVDLPWRNYYNGKTRKTMYFKNGYNEARGLAGLESVRVTLHNTGRLMNMIKVYKHARGVEIRVRDTAMWARMKSFETSERYGKKIWAFNVKELKEFTKLVQSETFDIFK